MSPGLGERGMYQFLFMFFIYAFLGWCTEVCYAALEHGKFINRGFLNGPVCPIYGFGAVLVLLALEPLRGSWPLLFLGSVFVTSLLELVTGFVLEKIFRRHWWDYSDEPFNLGGYICLRFSIMWGFACLFVVDLLHPTVLWLIRSIPRPLGVVLLDLCCSAMVVDLIATVRTIAKLRRRQSQADELAAKIRSLSNELGENLAERVLDAAQAGAELRGELDERAELLKERGDELREGLTQRRADLRENLESRRRSLDHRLQRAPAQRQEELRALRARLDRLTSKPIFGQNRLTRAFPGMGAALRLRRPERDGKN